MRRFADVLYVFKPYLIMTETPQGRFADQGIMYAGQPTLVYSQQPPTASQGVAYGPPAAVPYGKLLP